MSREAVAKYESLRSGVCLFSRIHQELKVDLPAEIVLSLADIAASHASYSILNAVRETTAVNLKICPVTSIGLTSDLSLTKQPKLCQKRAHD